MKNFDWEVDLVKEPSMWLRMIDRRLELEREEIVKEYPQALVNQILREELNIVVGNIKESLEKSYKLYQESFKKGESVEVRKKLSDKVNYLKKFQIELVNKKRLLLSEFYQDGEYEKIKSNGIRSYIRCYYLWTMTIWYMLNCPDALFQEKFALEKKMLRQEKIGYEHKEKNYECTGVPIAIIII